MGYFNRIFINFSVIIFFAFLFDCIFNKINLDVILNFIENILFAIILICPLYFIWNKKLSTLYFIFSFVMFCSVLLFETLYYYLFKTIFSASAIFVAMDSNMEESKEFIDFYKDLPSIFFSSVILIVLLVSLLRINIPNIKNLALNRKTKFKVFLLFLSIVVFLKFSKLIVYNFPYLVLKSSLEYRFESERLSGYKGNKNGDFVDLTKFSNNEEEVYVIIIGESTSRSHLGVYNYYRQTTPKLCKLKDELLIYKDVISPHAYSVAALTKILTLGNYEDPDGIGEGSIIQLANSLGFETYWVSNQRPIGAYESLITKISLSSKHSKFLTTTVAGKSKVLDQEILPEFSDILENDIKKKVIFIHLMGTHHVYQNRYPLNFDRFKDQPKTKFKSVENFNTINHYDNAVLYGDYIVSEIIEKVNNLNTKSFVLFFSDHGEEVFDDINTSGHNEDIYSKKMFDIPFFIWQSKKYKQEKKIPFFENRKYMLDDLFHSVGELLSAKNVRVDSTRSIFSIYYKHRTRIIKDTINYDTFFGKAYLN